MLQDVRYALRALCSSPGFSAIAILSLALGIGANTAIFSLINAVILKTLPVSHPEQLVELVMKTEAGLSFTNPIWEQVRDRQDVFSGAFAYSPIRLNLAGGRRSSQRERQLGQRGIFPHARSATRFLGERSPRPTISAVARRSACSATTFGRGNTGARPTSSTVG